MCLFRLLLKLISSFLHTIINPTLFAVQWSHHLMLQTYILYIFRPKVYHWTRTTKLNTWIEFGRRTKKKWRFFSFFFQRKGKKRKTIVVQLYCQIEYYGVHGLVEKYRPNRSLSNWVLLCEQINVNVLSRPTFFFHSVFIHNLILRLLSFLFSFSLDSHRYFLPSKWRSRSEVLNDNSINKKSSGSLKWWK